MIERSRFERVSRGLGGDRPEYADALCSKDRLAFIRTRPLNHAATDDSTVHDGKDNLCKFREGATRSRNYDSINDRQTRSSAQLRSENGTAGRSLGRLRARSRRKTVVDE